MIRMKGLQTTILFLNDNADDPTKRMKLAGVRRYAAAAGWNVVPIRREQQGRKHMLRLFAEYRAVGCICDDDGEPMKVTPRLLGGIPVIFANGHRSRFDSTAGRICVDDAAVARAAFRELSAGNPKAFAVVGQAYSPKWSVIRVNAFRAEVAKTGLPYSIIRENRWNEPGEFDTFIHPWLVSLPRHTAIYAVHDPLARRIADAAVAAGLRIPQDLTLLGTDNNPDFCEASRPTLSSIQLDFERMGYLAASLLAARMHCVSGTSSLERIDGSIATIGPLLAVRRESTRGHGRREPHILEAVEIIRREACDGLTVAALAARLPGSRSLLDLRFREAMGHSVHEEILQVRLERVFDLLRRPDMRIGAIADMSGFALHQLDKVFRTRFGCSLREWRKRNAGP